MNSGPSRDVLREWRESAPYWAKHADAVRAMFAPITAALIEAAEIREGQTVLDVAGGSGEPSVSIAEKTGEASLIICTDAVSEMVCAARTQARRRNTSNLDFTQCLAGSLPFPDNQFDAVICRLGIMLFPEPEDAAREMLRVVKPGRDVACAVWHARESNPFFHVVMDIVSRYVDSPPEDPDAPGAFRFAQRGKLQRMFTGCGADQVNERLLHFALEARLTPRQFWELRVDLSDSLRGKVRGLSAAQVEKIAKEVEEAGRAFFLDGRMSFPAEVLIIQARSG